MTSKDADVEELKRRQLAQEQAAREALEQADSRAEAETQKRRADKARYLREKLQERERAEREAAQHKD
jgi:DNA-binding TFAR19-related protein (PDSD5 family)